MKIQQAAHQILTKSGLPATSRELAEKALAKGLVSSNSKTPIQSLAATLEKNIREGAYNDPELTFLYTNKGRLIGLPSMRQPDLTDAQSAKEAYRTLTVKIPGNLAKQVELAAQAGLADSFDDTVTLLLRKGISAVTDKIKEGVLKRLEEFSE